MKQNVGPVAIIIGVIALVGVVFGIYKLTSGSATAGMTQPPAHAGDTKAAMEKASQEYAKNMQKSMQERAAKGQIGGPGGGPNYGAGYGGSYGYRPGGPGGPPR